MKLICERCGSSNDATAVRVEGGRVLMTCGACGVETTVVEPDGATSDAAPREPAKAAQAGSGSALAPVKCPRCFHRQDTADYCHRCGLDLSRPEPDTSDWDDLPDDAQEALARATEMWDALGRDPENEDRHAAFVALCTENRLLTWAVRRYREYLADHPGAPVMETYRLQAAKKLQTIAVTLLASDRWSDDVARRTRMARRILLIVAAVLLIAGLVLLVVVYKRTGSLAPMSF